MCKKVDVLLDRLDQSLKNESSDLSEICCELHDVKLSDKNAKKLTRILWENKRWKSIFFIFLLLFLFFGLISFVTSAFFSGVYYLLLTVLPSSIAISITLFMVLVTVNLIQCG